MEVVLPEAATLTELASSLLAPEVLPGLWSGHEIAVQDVYDYFGGETVVQVQREGYEEPVFVPAAPKEVVDEAVEEAVRSGKLWLLSGPASVWAEEVPVGLLTPVARLLPPPEQIPTGDLLAATLPEAWEGETTTALAIAAALSNRAGENLPWPVVRQALDDAFRAHFLDRTPDSGAWPWPYSGGQNDQVRGRGA